jgi:hypothetical protein
MGARVRGALRHRGRATLDLAWGLGMTQCGSRGEGGGHWRRHRRVAAGQDSSCDCGATGQGVAGRVATSWGDENKEKWRRPRVSLGFGRWIF